MKTGFSNGFFDFRGKSTDIKPLAGTICESDGDFYQRGRVRKVVGEGDFFTALNTSTGKLTAYMNDGEEWIEVK